MERRSSLPRWIESPNLAGAHSYSGRMTSEGRTERLILKPLELADTEQIQALFPHWVIVRYLLNRVPWPYPPDGALFYCREIALPQMERGEAWHWTLRLRTAPVQCELRPYLRSSRETVRRSETRAGE